MGQKCDIWCVISSHSFCLVVRRTLGTFSYQCWVSPAAIASGPALWRPPSSSSKSSLLALSKILWFCKDFCSFSLLPPKKTLPQTVRNISRPRMHTSCTKFSSIGCRVWLEMDQPFFFHRVQWRLDTRAMLILRNAYFPFAHFPNGS